MREYIGISVDRLEVIAQPQEFHFLDETELFHEIFKFSPLRPLADDAKMPILLRNL